ncbi:MAG: histidine phosphatase family protein [Anaerolineae bacterium]|jgi:alpha-ribazole phosphatase
MPRLLLVRHGETRANAEARYQGQNDTPLNRLGLEQAGRLAERLSAEPIERILVSDLPRALQTAQPVSERLGLPSEPDARLREIDVGEWEGLTFAEIQQRYPELAAQWDHNPGHTRIPGGESAADMAVRVGALLADLRGLPDEQGVLLVTHGGWLQTLLCLCLHVDLQWRYQFRLHNASVSVLSLYGQHAMLELFNDHAHLQGLA